MWPQRSYRLVTLAAALVSAALLAACDNIPSSLRIIPEAGTMAVARLEPKNGSTVRGTISFTQRGSKVWISANITELFPGPHSLYIHMVGNCTSPNAASAGPVWNVAGAATGDKRTGDLPQIYAGTEGNALLQFTTPDLSVGTGAANDVIGHSVVVHQALDPDPKAEFGVRNGWLACGVLERSQGLDLKKLL
jgi:Cu-Zn family superoxide dismutase